MPSQSLSIGSMADFLQMVWNCDKILVDQNFSHDILWSFRAFVICEGLCQSTQFKSATIISLSAQATHSPHLCPFPLTCAAASPPRSRHSAFSATCTLLFSPSHTGLSGSSTNATRDKRGKAVMTPDAVFHSITAPKMYTSRMPKDWLRNFMAVSTVEMRGCDVSFTTT